MRIAAGCGRGSCLRTFQRCYSPRPQTGQHFARTHGKPHVTDFGLARRLDDQPLGITATGDLLGTPNYMAPEQVNCSQRPSRSDNRHLRAWAQSFTRSWSASRRSSPESVAETCRRFVPSIPCAPRQAQSPRAARLGNDLSQMPGEIAQPTATARPTSWPTTCAGSSAARHVLARPVSRLERGRRWFVRNPVVGTLAVGIALALVAGTAFSTYYACDPANGEQEALANLYAADMNLAQQHSAPAQ